MMPEALLVHASPGRLRIRVPSKKGDARALIFFKEQCAACPGVSSIEVNPVTASLLIHHYTDSSAIGEYARSRNLFVLKEHSADPENFRTDITTTFKSIDRGIRSITGGRMDMRGLAFAILIGAGALQIAAEEAGALPWYAAFWYAFSILQGPQETQR